MKTKHTPGPWQVCRTITGSKEMVEYVGTNGNGEKRFNAMVENSQYHIAGVGGTGQEECLANARLIAFADEVMRSGYVPEDHGFYSTAHHAMNHARAAIAKAKGET